MNLVLLDGSYSIVKLPPLEEVPAWAGGGEFASITHTKEELSIVCPTSNIPDAALMEAEHDWRCIKVDGVLDFGLTGILASLANPLAENHISIFAVSTFNTDYLLIKTHLIDQAVSVLENAGHVFLK